LKENTRANGVRFLGFLKFFRAVSFKAVAQTDFYVALTSRFPQLPLKNSNEEPESSPKNQNFIY
jgi:hypothetical protein